MPRKSKANVQFIIYERLSLHHFNWLTIMVIGLLCKQYYIQTPITHPPISQHDILKTKINSPLIHDVVFMVAPIEENPARKQRQTGQQKQQNFQALFPAIDKVSVKDVRVFR